MNGHTEPDASDSEFSDSDSELPQINTYTPQRPNSVRPRPDNNSNTLLTDEAPLIKRNPLRNKHSPNPPRRRKLHPKHLERNPPNPLPPLPELHQRNTLPLSTERAHRIPRLRLHPHPPQPLGPRTRALPHRPRISHAVRAAGRSLGNGKGESAEWATLDAAVWWQGAAPFGVWGCGYGTVCKGLLV